MQRPEALLRDDSVYTVSEAARLLGVSRASIWRWVSRGLLPAERVGPRGTRIRGRDLRAMRRPARSPELAAGSEWPLFANYDPEATRQAFREAAGTLAGIDIEALLRDLREARGQKPGRKAALWRAS